MSIEEQPSPLQITMISRPLYPIHETRPLPIAARRAFTLFEFLIALAIIGLILASVVPFILHKRELNRRITCERNLWVLRTAMKGYANTYGSYPRVKYDEQKRPNSWTAYTGADDPNPFAPDSAVQPNDVTASLWLLVREGYVTDLNYFICPSAGGKAETFDSLEAARKRGNFRGGHQLGYSMFSPFTSAPEFYWSDTLIPDVAVLADKSPGISGGIDRVDGVPSNASPEAFVVANSNNHRKAGQNVLYADGSVVFVATPYAGVGVRKDENGNRIPGQPADNIYTAMRATPFEKGQPAVDANGEYQPRLDVTGVYGKSVGAAWSYDSFLVPSDDD